MSRAALFSGLRASRVLELAQQSFIQCLDPGDLLFREGDRGNSLYVVASGHLRLFTTDGSTITMPLLSRGKVDNIRRRCETMSGCGENRS